MRADSGASAFLLVEITRSGQTMWSVKWRSADGDRVKRRLGHRAWVRSGPDGRWVTRSGRPRDGELTEFQARRLVPQFVADAERLFAAARTRAKRSSLPTKPTFRELAHAWLAHLETVEDAKPSTLIDYRVMLKEPDVPYQRGTGRTLGRIMRPLGDLAAADVTREDIDALLTELDKQPISRRTVNKHRATLHAIFNFSRFPRPARPLGRRAEPRDRYAQAPPGGSGASRGLHGRAD